MSYPEHDKLRAVADQSQVCGDLLEWLMERYELAMWEGVRLYGQTVHVDALLAEYFEIDRDKLEAEKRQMLEALRLDSQAN